MGSAATDGASDTHEEILLAEHLDTGDTEELMEYLECGPEGIPSNQQLVRMGDNNNTQSIADYLAQLLKDKKQLAAFPNVFIHMERQSFILRKFMYLLKNIQISTSLAES